jgi:hypothetical protein
LQLEEAYARVELYGDNYGYRSGLNSSMVQHLANVARYLEGTYNPHAGDIIVDIGANDGTLLHQYQGDLVRFAIDPTAEKFREFYQDDIHIIPKFFTRDLVPEHCARIVTTIAMFYDAPFPLQLANDVAHILAHNGVWYLELAYVGDMLLNTSYDAICQEHLGYYGISQLRDVACRAGLHITNFGFNKINGGSVWALLQKGKYEHPHVGTAAYGEREFDFSAFAVHVTRHAYELQQLLATCGDRVAGFGASTKGNTMMQHCNINREHVFAVADVNPDKWGRVTATGIPIMSDEDVDALNPTHYLVFPWHFRENILERYRGTGRKFIFPLPEPEVVVA